MKLSSRSICSPIVSHTRTMTRGRMIGVRVLVVVEGVLAVRAKVRQTTLVYGVRALIRATLELLQSFKLLHIVRCPLSINTLAVQKST